MDPVRKLKVAYLFTTFPVLSETFLMREIRALQGRPELEIHLHSLWGGAPDFEGHPVRVFSKWRLLTLFWRLFYWLLRKPSAFVETLTELWSSPMPSLLNCGETFLGFGFALVSGRRFLNLEYDLIHGPWASLPATAARSLSCLTGIPYTMGAHAFDIFDDGGDWLLEEKLATARSIQTSNSAAKSKLIQCGAAPDKIFLIRRCLDSLPSRKTQVHPVDRRKGIANAGNNGLEKLRLLSVGRLVEKKGYERQIAIYAELKKRGIPFEARIAGGGPMKKKLISSVARYELSDSVFFLGRMPYPGVEHLHAWADLFLFTGIVSKSGNRDGLPNVIAEAMAAGLPVIGSDVGSVSDAVRDNETGILMNPAASPVHWVDRMLDLIGDEKRLLKICNQARNWVTHEFDPERMAGKLVDMFEKAVADGREMK